MGVQLVLLAGSTPLNVASDKLGKARPPEFHCNKLMDLKVTWVASYFMIMAMVDYGLLE